MRTQSPWIHSASFDLIFIFAPQIVIAVLLIAYPNAASRLGELPPWLWLLLIVGVDVSHVYSTIFRTYLDPRERERQPGLYQIVPIVGWIVGVILYSLNPLYFWRSLAYLALFHFVRQQYGFVMIYSAKVKSGNRRLDSLVIYCATLYPVLFWHCHGRSFNWFIAHDFVSVNLPSLASLGLIAYIVVMSAFVLAEVREFLTQGRINIQKVLLVGATALTWWVGIISFDNDIAFTATNVVAHGVPYLALIWIYKRRESRLVQKRSLLFSPLGVPIYLAALLCVAFLEEGLWDSLIWREHKELFSLFWTQLRMPESVLALVVPLLALPQLLHYVYDALIWRLREGDPHWREVLFYRGES